MIFVSTPANVLVILDQVVEIIVGQSLSGLAQHRIFELIGDGRRPGQEPQILHTVLITGVNNRIVLIISVDDVVVWLAIPP